MRSVSRNDIRNTLFLFAFGTIVIVIVAAVQSLLLINVSTNAFYSNKVSSKEEDPSDLIVELDLGAREPGTTEEIEIRSTLSEAKMTVALIRLYINGGRVIDFKSEHLALPVCDNAYYYSENRICADIAKMDEIQPGELLATITIEWDKDIEGSIWQERAGGYYSEADDSVLVDIGSLPLTGEEDGSYGDSTPDGSFVVTNELRMFISAASLLLMVGITYISEKIVKAKNATKIFKTLLMINFVFVIYSTSLYIQKNFFAPSDTLAYSAVDRDELVTPLKARFVVTNAYGFACSNASGPGAGFHSGIDMKLQQVIYAAGPGKIIHAGVVGGWTPLGNMVTIEHTSSDGGKYYTRYAHLQNIYVSVGDIVGVDTELGMMGTTGNSNGIHLHFEVRRATNTWVQSDFYDPTEVIYRQRGEDEEQEDEQEEISEPLLCGQKGCMNDDDCGTGAPDYECDESLTDWPNNNQCVRVCPSGYIKAGSCECITNITPTPIIPTTTPVSYQQGIVCGPMDFNGDGKLNFVDLANLSRKYNQNCSDYYDDEECGGLDSNHDYRIDYEDLYQFTSRYYPRALNCNKRDLP